MANTILQSPIIVFIISLIVAGIIYGIGGKISPPTKESKDKVSTYACGEDMRPIKTSLSVKLFNYAALFLILDVIAIMLALSMGISAAAVPIVGLLAVVYILIVLLSVGMLLKGT